MKNMPAVDLLISCIISCVFFFTPVLAQNVSGGFAIIIAAVVSALIVVFLRKQVAGKAGTVTAILAGIFLIVIMVFMAPVHKEQASSVAADVSAGKLDNKVFIPLLLVMALTTYIVRMIPFVLFRKKLERPSVKAFFDYIPYTVLSAMTFPAILYATGSYISALVGFIVSLVLGFFEKSLLTVAIGACVASLVTGVIVMYI